MFWLPLTGAMPQPVLLPLGKAMVLAPLAAIVPLAAPDAPDALPLIVMAPVDAPDVAPDATTPEEPTPLAAPEAVSPVVELPVLAPDVVPLPGVPLIPVLEVPETEVPLPEPTAIVPVPGLLQAQSPMARRVRYPNQRIFRDLSDNFSAPRAWGGRIAPAQPPTVKVSGFSALSRLSGPAGLVQRGRQTSRVASSPAIGCCVSCSRSASS